MDLRVSVIIPTYNHGKYIKESIKSVLNQTYKNIEILVVDDGSRDDTNKIVKEFKNAVRYLYQENKGQSAARNMGINKSHGELLAFIDADDLWLPNKLDLQLKLLLNRPDVGMVACGANIIDESGNYVEKYVPKNFEKQDDLLKALYICQIIPGSSSGVLIRRECLEEVGYFDERLKIAADWDMWLRIAKRFKIIFIEEPLVSIRRLLNKPEFRTPAGEDHFVSMIIEKNIEGRYKNNAYAILYSRIGSYYLSMSKKKEAIKYFLRSIYRFPFPLFPGSFKKQNLPYGDSRYYLLIKCILPNYLISLAKSIGSR